jgi:hypothetical protein
MQSSRVIKLKSRKTSKPARSPSDCYLELTDSISVEENIMIVICTECVNHNAVCYYDWEQLVKCVACLQHQCDYDGTFSLEEFRKVGEQKKVLVLKSYTKWKEIARLWKVLANLKSEDS